MSLGTAATSGLLYNKKTRVNGTTFIRIFFSFHLVPALSTLGILGLLLVYCHVYK
jgi:hypothetical protein